MPFEVGNQYAANGKPFKQALNRVLAQSPEKLRQIAEGLVEAAIAKEPWAVKEIVDRLDGKAIQQLDITEENKQIQAIPVRELGQAIAFALQSALEADHRIIEHESPALPPVQD